jgi:hypothetical protein
MKIYTELLTILHILKCPYEIYDNKRNFMSTHKNIMDNEFLPCSEKM